MKQDIKPPADPQTVPAARSACQADGKTSTQSNTIVKIRESEQGNVSYRLEKSSPAQSTIEPALTKSARSQKTLTLSSIATVVVVVGAYFGYQAYQNHQKSTTITANGATPPVVTVTSCQSRTQPVKDALSVTGSVWAWDPLSVGAEVNGLRITSVTVEEGDHVRKGQVLATLNSTLLRAQLQQAKARLLSSQANHNKAIQPNRPEDILALEAALAQAEANVAQEEARRKQADANLGNAEVMAGRFTQLAKAGAISTQDAENKQVSAITAREEVKSADEKVNASRFTVDQARQRLLMATRGGRIEDIAISRANIEEIKAQIQHLQHQIDQTILKAPDNGLISKRDAHIGDITSVGTPLFSMVRLNKLELRAQVNDIDIAKLKPGQAVNISVHEEQDTRIAGKVRLVNPLVDATTRMGIVRIDLPNYAGLKPGMFLKGEIQLGTRQSVTVPLESLVTRNGESVVFKLSSDNRVTSTAVTTGVQTDSFIEIKEGLAPGEAIAAKGARFLSDGDTVRVGK